MRSMPSLQVSKSTTSSTYDNVSLVVDGEELGQEM